jgi:diaminopimelate epimerase
VGADGLLVAESADGYAARMTLYNADGSRAEMSGNGIRCFAQAVAARRGDLSDQLILTDAGERHVVLTATDDPATIMARVEMGEVSPLDEPTGWATLGCHPDRPVVHLSLGNPHSVVGVDEVAVVDLVDLGSKVPHVNLEIVEPGPEPGAVTMRVHERGAGITEACGTGACAVAFAARSWGLVARGAGEVVVHMAGGTATVSFADDAPDRAVLTGPATFVATIEIEVP